MTKGVSFPLEAKLSKRVIPAQAGIQIQLDPQSEALRFRLRMTRGMSFPLEAKLSKRVIPVKTGIQSVISGSPIRSASLSVEDDTGAFG